MSSQKWTLFLVKQGKFKVGVVQADGLGFLDFLNLLNGVVYMAMSAGASPNNFWPI
jgi:hypothetical protein